jgi:hypothetical protein
MSTWMILRIGLPRPYQAGNRKNPGAFTRRVGEAFSALSGDGPRMNRSQEARTKSVCGAVGFLRSTRPCRIVAGRGDSRPRRGTGAYRLHRRDGTVAVPHLRMVREAPGRVPWLAIRRDTFARHAPNELEQALAIRECIGNYRLRPTQFKHSDFSILKWSSHTTEEEWNNLSRKPILKLSSNCGCVDEYRENFSVAWESADFDRGLPATRIRVW